MRALFLESEAGVIRIQPYSDKIIRISYTENGIFSNIQGEEFTPFSKEGKWEYKEFADHIRLTTDFLVVIINRENGSIRYENKAGYLFLSEKQSESKQVEEFDSYRLVVNENTETAQVKTADGVRRVIRSGEKKVDKKLYRTRISFAFQPDEALYGLGQSQEGVLNLRGTVQYLHQANRKIAVPMLDYYCLAGDSIDQVINGNRKLTGKAVMLPRWMFWEENMWGQKSFDRKRFPDPEGMPGKLRESKVHFMMSIWPNMDHRTENHQEFAGKNLLLPATDIYDALSQEGRALYWNQLKRGLYCHGIRSWWCDSSEPVSPEWNHVVEQEPSHMYHEYVEAASDCMPMEKINAYGLYHAKGIFENQRSENDGHRVVNLTRSGYSGSQKYGAVFWSGDISASWETLEKQIAAGLNFCVCGLPCWTVDVG